jgi:Predicted metal-dependent hydrolase
MTAPFLPPHSIRISRRARRISLRILRGIGLEVVLPPWADRAMVPEILARHEGWIRKHALPEREDAGARSGEGVFTGAESAGAGSQGRGGSGKGAQPFPPGLFLRGGAEFYAFRQSYAEEPPCRAFMIECARELLPPHTGELVEPGGANLVLPAFHCPENPAKTFLWLREWLREEARSRFAFTLDALAEEHGFTYARLFVKFQKTRWGSCSAKGNINISALLLFLPDALIRYILVHELCHTRALNHSEAFWKEVFAILPKAMRHDAAMRRAWVYVPFWAFG